MDDLHDVEHDEKVEGCHHIQRVLGLFCCGMIRVRIFVLLELLPLALSDLKIGSNGGVEVVPSLGCFLFHCTKLCAMLQEIRLVIELVL